MTRTLTETEYVALPNGLQNGRNAALHGITAYTALAAALGAAGYGSDTSAELQLVGDIIAAARGEAAASAATLIDSLDIDTLAADEAASVVREASLLLVRSFSTAPAVGGAIDLLERRLLPRAQKACKTLADEAVEQMRPTFMAALKKVSNANTAGLTPEHTAAQIANEGSPQQLTAYRELGAAVATLDRIADMRIRIANILFEPGSHNVYDDELADQHAMASFLADASDIEGAARSYAGVAETVLVQPAHPGAGPNAKRISRPRLGGAWLALVAGGYRLQLNTPAQVDAALAQVSP